MRLKFETLDSLPYNKIKKLPVCVIIISSVFKEKDDGYYPQILLYDCFYEYEDNLSE